MPSLRGSAATAAIQILIAERSDATDIIFSLAHRFFLAVDCGRVLSGLLHNIRVRNDATVAALRTTFSFDPSPAYSLRLFTFAPLRKRKI